MVTKTMYIITKEKSIRKQNIIGIFDLDNSTVSSVTKNFLSTAEKENRISGTNVLPRSFILIDSKNNKKYKKRNKYNHNRYNKSKNFKIYFSSNLSKYLK